MADQVSSFTDTQLYDRVRGDIGLRGNNLLVDADILRWANEAVRMLADYTQYHRKTATMNVTSGTAEYDYPTDLITLERLYHNDIPLGVINFSDLMRADPNWLTTSQGTPGWYYQRGAAGFGVYPTPDTTVAAGFDLYYTAFPATVASGTFTIPTANDYAIVAYCLYRASLKDITGEGRERAAIYQREWLEEKDRLKQAVSNLLHHDLVVYGSDGTLSMFRDPLSYRVVPMPGAE